MLMVPKSVSLAVSEVSMSESNRNVQKTDVQTLDILKGALTKGLHRLVVRTRKMRLNVWTGSVAAEETVTTVEPTDARR
jgi:hypothetical protein